ncbi:MAG: PQQ-like beta-propeller repeat protein [Caldilineaceae bacterium]|nr:PQQ-like beta-propeller repeat protein [Caldilineaceae bacterium]
MSLRVLVTVALISQPLAALFGDDTAFRAGPDWPQWRGPRRDGTALGPAWPEQLGPESLQPKWRIALQKSYSGPLIAGDRIIVTETRDEDREAVSSYDRENGSLIWWTEWAGAMTVPFFAKSNGDWIRSTPAIDDDRLYVAGMRDTLRCLDANNGSILWQKDFVDEFDAPLPSFGCVCSPLVSGNALYIQAGAGLLKLDKFTGEILWRSLMDGGGMSGSAFSSPYLTKLAGREQLLVQSRTHLSGINPIDGTLLWTQEIAAFRGMNIVTPVVSDDAVFTSSYGGKSLLFNVNADGGGELTVNLTWDNKAQGYMCSPVVIDGHVYLHLRNQRFTCIDLRTGETKWTTTPFGKYWSLIVQGDRILALDEDGTLRLIQATPEEFRLVDECKISDQECWAHLAISGEQIVVRELEGLAVYRWAK